MSAARINNAITPRVFKERYGHVRRTALRNISHPEANCKEMFVPKPIKPDTTTDAAKKQAVAIMARSMRDAES